MTQPTPQQQQQAPTRAQIAAVAAVVATAGSVAAVAAGLASATGISVATAQALLDGIGFKLPAVPVAQLGPAARQVAGSEPAYRAAYLVAAAGRVRARVAAGQSYADAIAAEQPNWQAHLAAQRNRAVTATTVDRAAAKHRSLVLGWRARMDARTSAECAAADGKNFLVTQRPLIGYPGSVHPNCRCRVVAPFHNGEWVDGSVAAAEKVAATA